MEKELKERSLKSHSGDGESHTPKLQIEAFIKYSPGAIAMVDTEMRYLMVNDGWYRDYGLKENDIIGKSHYEIFPEVKEKPEWLDYHQRALAGESLRADFDSFQIGDKNISLDWKLEPWYHPDGAIGGIIMFTDVKSDEEIVERRRKEHDNVLKTLLNEMEDGFAHARIVRDENGKPIDWQYINVGKGLEKYVPVPPETLVGKKVSDAIPGAIEADPKWLDIFNEVATTGKSREIEEYSEVLKRWFRMNIYSPAKDEFATIFRDTTVQNESQQKIKSLNQLFEDVSKMARIGAWEVNVETQECYWSEMVYQIHEEDPSKKILVEEGINYFHPDYKDTLEQAVNNAIENNEPYDLELKLITAKGREIWTRAIGRPVFEGEKLTRLQGLFQDINDSVENQRKIEDRAEKLKLLNERFTIARDAASLGVWDWDIPNNILEWDDYLYDIYGLKKEDFSNSYEAWYQGIHPDDRERSNKEVQECLETGNKLDTRFRVIWPSGEVRHIGAMGKVIKDSEGNPVRMLGVNWDITDQVAQEEEIKSLNANLQEKVEERTEALKKVNKELEAFSYSISHDLRAPLRAINGYSLALKDDHQSLPETAVSYLDRIVVNSRKMGELIDDLLEFSRMNRKKVNHSEIDLTMLVTRLIDEIYEDSREVVTLESLPTIWGDRQMLEQVFSNLISNAIKYSSKEEKPEVIISSEEEEKAYVISIEDNGVGFNMDYYDKIFQVFQRLHTEDEFEGTGIGLAICHKIMKAHDAEIWAEAEVGKGAVFYLKFNK
ncbi:PAS domain-containing protein [Ekhidna sp.]|jgi:PAS domain S-box-containing protein|uniref:PAS domain-containing protein n=1 Tax=Ekhidna sp. TaxID=2608089 RepID=UPI0032EB502B